MAQLQVDPAQCVFDATTTDAATATAALEEFGCVVLRNNLRREDVAAISRRALARYSLAEAYRNRGDDYPAPPEFKFRPASNAMHPDALKSDELLATECPAPDVVELLRESLATQVMRQFLGGRAYYWRNTSSLRKVYLRAINNEKLKTIPLHCDGNSFSAPKQGQVFVTCVVPLTAFTSDAPHIEFRFPRERELVQPGTGDGDPFWKGMEVSEEAAREKYGDMQLWHPHASLGDVIILDQFILHRTHIAPDMSQERMSFDIRVANSDETSANGHQFEEL